MSILDMSQALSCLWLQYINQKFITNIKRAMSWFFETVVLLPSRALREVSKYGVFSGPYFPAFSPDAGKYGPEKNPYLNTFYAVRWWGCQTLWY